VAGETIMETQLTMEQLTSHAVAPFMLLLYVHWAVIIACGCTVRGFLCTMEKNAKDRHDESQSKDREIAKLSNQTKEELLAGQKAAARAAALEKKVGAANVIEKLRHKQTQNQFSAAQPEAKEKKDKLKKGGTKHDGVTSSASAPTRTTRSRTSTATRR